MKPNPLVNLPDDASNHTCVIVLSGGQDSVTCLGLALQHFKTVVAVSFSYGQKHSVELNSAASICEAHNVEHHIIETNALIQIGDSALLCNSEQDVGEGHTNKEGLPASFVPNRNAFFLTMAHAFAQKIGAAYLMTGVCQTDYSGYPDCRDVFIRKLEDALNLGSNSTIAILTPLMWLDKAQTFKMAEDYDFLDIVLNETHTCYNGKHGPDYYNEWGYGCGECPACELRAKGWQEFLDNGA
ncbi:MAG: putative 7-cyano-7-deazaguanine synthase [Prokaryotic dsDNA virus sp.]|nr:MAG: putative 7-cyano-7-deazaguanine synthase [Prokaryotic dsDNA virus sp.]|tara:strand:+ start:26456 stop:27178 length:723 start_codon:yes stop_codon:yes gene_type:complete